jgi:iron complex outermembrane receptor protein
MHCGIACQQSEPAENPIFGVPMTFSMHSKLVAGISNISILAALVATPAAAQEAADNSENTTVTLGTIYLKGEKTVRQLKDTASSASVVSANELETQAAGKDSLARVLNGSANIIYADSVSAPVIRGLDTQGPQNGSVAFFAGTVPRGTVSIDGHYLGYNELYYGTSSVWDIDSFEVFRGPQTTSQGANAIAGAIIINTRDPSFYAEGAYRAEVGGYNSRRLSFSYSAPITPDLAGRIAVDYSARDTFIDYTNDAFVKGNADQDFYNLTVRGKLLWVPSGIDGLEVKLTYSHSDTNRPTQEMSTLPYDDLNNAYATTVPGWEQRQDTLSLDVDQDLGNGLSLFSQTSVADGRVERRAGAGNGDADIDTNEISNETRLTFGVPEDELSGMAGVYVRRVEATEELRLSTGNSNFDDTKTNLGLFAEMTWRFADRWSLTAGARFERDQIERSGTSSYATTAADYDHTFEALLPKVSIAYQVTPDWTVGAMISKGYNPGGLSLNFSTGEWQEFKDEKIWNYELFTRASLIGEKLFLTSNLFYMDYRDAQYNILTEVSPGTFYTYTINAEKSHAYGLELGIDYQPIDAVTLSASAGLLRTKVDTISGNTSYEGNAFAKSPEYTLTLGGSWRVTDRLSLGGQLRHVDGYFSDVPNTAAYEVDGYTITDLQASYWVKDGIEIYGYVNNVFDERSATFMQFNRTGGGTEASLTTPRTVGIGIRGAF